jgi:hypothetical protein
MMLSWEDGMSRCPGESIGRAIGRKNGNAGLQQAEMMTKMEFGAAVNREGRDSRVLQKCLTFYIDGGITSSTGRKARASSSCSLQSLANDQSRKYHPKQHRGADADRQQRPRKASGYGQLTGHKRCD